jgi:hypothetical protein
MCRMPLYPGFMFAAEKKRRPRVLRQGIRVPQRWPPDRD